MATATATQAVKRVGRHSVRFETTPSFYSAFTVVGKMECDGPLGAYFDTVIEDSYYGESTWEKAESKMLKEAVSHAISKANLTEQEIDMCLTSDLLNQCVSSSLAMRDCKIPHFGLYSACASFAQALILGSMALDGGFADHVVAGVSSHHDALEREFRFPTEYGMQRPPYAQWTVTGAGAVVLGLDGSRGPRITAATIGEVHDLGVKDAYNMGAAMAPAAAETLQKHFEEFEVGPEAYDLIVTGDLSRVGSAINEELLKRAGWSLGDRYTDCGVLIYSKDQDVHSGASGMGSSGTVFPAYLLSKMRNGEIGKMLLAGTGALNSPISTMEGESIPAICHAVVIEC